MRKESRQRLRSVMTSYYSILRGAHTIIADIEQITEVVRTMRETLQVFGTSFFLPENFPSLPNLKKFFCCRQLCFEKVLAGRQAPLELLGLWFNESDGSVPEVNNPVMIAKSSMRSSYISLLSFWYDASEIKDSLVSDASWFDLSSTWQCLLPSDKQRLLPGHGVVTRTAAISSSDPMILL